VVAWRSSRGEKKRIEPNRGVLAMARVRALAEAGCFPSLGQGEVRSEWIARGERDSVWGGLYICLLRLFLTVRS
jgi:hypothetical protein